ncbi:MAG TPA: hypothetical protein VF072_13990, partial [Thermoleophilaceae bacterium]
WSQIAPVFEYRDNRRTTSWSEAAQNFLGRSVRMIAGTSGARSRLAFVGAVAIVAALAIVPAASASKPDRGTFDFTDSFTDTEVCAAEGFDVFVPLEHEYGFFNVFFDQDGNATKVIAHVNYDATITANGKTIYERDTYTNTFYPDGSDRSTGLTVHIQGAGGIVQLDAGQIVRDADGNVVYTHGPHPQLNGETFCSALAP